jgi:hypothetical protein
MTLDVLRALFPLSIPRKVSPKHVEVFAEHMLREACPVAAPPSADTAELEWISARRGALRLAGLYVAVERGQA